MKRHWLNGFVRYLDRQALILDIEGYGQSRKISDSGWPYASSEIRCYRTIHFHIERGLAHYVGPVTEVLKVVHHFQRDCPTGTQANPCHGAGPATLRVRRNPAKT